MKITFNQNLYAYNISFSSREDVMKKSEQFSRQMTALLKRKNCSQEEIFNLMHSFGPDMEICKVRPKTSRGARKVGEFISNYEYSGQNRRFKLKDMLMTVMSLTAKDFTKIDSVGSLTHEMTHYFQSKDKDESISNIFNKYLAGLSRNAIEKNVSIGFKFWYYFEDTLINDYMNFYYHSSSVNKNRFPFDVKIEPQTMKKCIEDKFKHAKKLYPRFNDEFLKEFVRFHLNAEADAYEAEAKAMQNYRNKPLGREDLLLPDLYRQIANCIE